ncbi:MAG: 16S rRNA (guanine(966)-N(2))-methyltransferase RsmD [Clostridiales bacterium]|nr:16S rRNA (guanine(966)-N(2))-methyltransferase RsmD [Clostridiales bacterium]
MRVVGGLYKGRVLVPFDGDRIRPTSDKVRESFYNIVRDKVYGCNFLDLFCGTGAMGIEALSRGASFVQLNDFSKDSLTVVKKNLEKLKITDNVKITNFDATGCLKNSIQKFDIIYIDPPYKSDLGIKVLPFVGEALTDDGIAVYESETPFNERVSGLEIYDTRKYGRAYLTFFKKGE